MLGQGRRGYLGAFARANLIARYPGDRFPLREAAELSERLAQRLAPRPLILLGRGVSHAFRFPSPEHMIWEDYLLGSTLIRAATLPHPSGRNLWYNDPVNRIRVGEWLREQVRAHSQE